MGSVGAAIDNYQHVIVALETQWCPIPTFSFPAPYTYIVNSYQATRPDEIASRIQPATILLLTTLRLTAFHLSAECTPHLRMIAAMASGTDHLGLDVCRKRGIRVCNASKANVPAVSEHAIGLYFSARRKFRPIERSARAGDWVNIGSCIKLMGDADGMMPPTCREEVLGVIGYGAIGQRIAEIAKLLGMKVLIADRKGATSIRTGRMAFEDVLKQSTVLMLVLPRTPESLGLISTAELKTMNRQVVIVNVSRGGIIDEEALVQALREGSIAGAASDVFLEEPAGPGNSVLFREENSGLNLTLTPHLAWVAETTTGHTQLITKQNVEAWLAGKPVNVVA